MIRRLYQRFKSSSIRGWMIIGSMLGISALPCPECGTPLILHIWPIAILFLVARSMKKHYKKTDLFLSERNAKECELPGSVHGHDGHGLDEILHFHSHATIVDHTEKLE